MYNLTEDRTVVTVRVVVWALFRSLQIYDGNSK